MPEGDRGSYVQGRLGVRGRARELLFLLQYQRRDASSRAARGIADLDSGHAEMEQALGSPLRDKEILVVGPGQQLLEMAYFARQNRVTGIDLDLIRANPNALDYLRMWRTNGGIRTVKTLGRKLTGADRAFRVAVERQTGMSLAQDYDVIAMDASAMTFADGSFDCVYSHSCFEHLADPESVMRNIARVLRPGGLAHIEVHLYTSDSGCHDVRIFTGRRESIPPWSHLRARFARRVQANSYLNEVRLDTWRELFSRVWPGATFRLRRDTTPERPSQLQEIRAGGELVEYSDEELLNVFLVAEWTAPASRAAGR